MRIVMTAIKKSYVRMASAAAFCSALNVPRIRIRSSPKQRDLDCRRRILVDCLDTEMEIVGVLHRGLEPRLNRSIRFCDAEEPNQLLS
jgi:hypothetical protein